MLSSSKEVADLYPDHVAVIGGGRWSRVFIEVLCRILPSFVRISVHSPHNAKSMSAWASGREFAQRVHVSSDFPEPLASVSSAVIVVNAARDHEKAIEWALSAGIPVLVEKPLTLSFAATRHLADLACKQNTYFAAAHVFLFARYVEAFAKIISAENDIQSVRVHWMDPMSESRYGESKNYDPGLTVFADWLPHVLSILGALTKNQVSVGERLEFSMGGAHLGIEIMLGDIPCNIQLTRNGSCRQRIVDVTTQGRRLVLDFAREPGLIIDGSEALCADPDWDAAEKPVSRMLSAFLKSVATGERDGRLDVEVGLQASRVIDQISELYSAALCRWLGKELLKLEGGYGCDVRYALSEILHIADPHSSIPVEQRIDYIYAYIKAHGASLLVNDISFDRPVELVRWILKQGKLSA